MSGHNPTTRLGHRWWSGLLEGIEMFDADFFGVRAREARLLDPQQRLLLEVTHEALQDAGTTIADLAGSATGVFVGQHRCDYADLLRDHGLLDSMVGFLGTSPGSTSGRLSYTFDLHGPSLTVDAACTSSAVALHLAMTSIRSGECDQAIVGGVNLVLDRRPNDALAAARMTSADGRCKFADATADGLVRSDGIATVILRPLASALAAGDRVRAVIRGSAVRNSGRRSDHMLIPSSVTQDEIIHAACSDAGIRPDELDYIEAHGTGTVTGDEAELSALEAVVSADSGTARSCLVGSVKSSIGHTESTAGLLGVISAVLCLEHGEVPPNPSLAEPHPRLLRRDSRLRLPGASAVPLPDRGRATLAGVNGLGASGTGAHIVLEAASAEPRQSCGTPSERPEIVMLSARTSDALDELEAAYRSAVPIMADDVTLEDLATASTTRRDLHVHRCVVVARSLSEIPALLADSSTDRVVRGVAADGHPEIAFVFSGHGSQWVGMGSELLRTDDVFVEAVSACDVEFRKMAGWSIIDRLRDGHRVDNREIDVAQPMLWAMQVGLAELWRSWGIEPDVVIGHSVGEVAASQVAGILDVGDAASVVRHRSLLASRQRGCGAMLLTELSPAAAAAAVADHGSTVTVASHNGPATTVLAGDVRSLRKMVALFDRTRVGYRWIDIDIASHGPQMAAVAADLADVLAHVRPGRATIPMRSSVTTRVVDGAELDAAYWVANLCRPVRFTETLSAVTEDLFGQQLAVVEIAPHPVLLPSIRQTLAGTPGAASAVASTLQHEPEREALLRSLGQLVVRGATVAGQAARPGRGGRHIDLPKHPWQHRAHWPKAPVPTPALLRPVQAAEPEAAVVRRDPQTAPDVDSGSSFTDTSTETDRSGPMWPQCLIPAPASVPSNVIGLRRSAASTERKVIETSGLMLPVWEQRPPLDRCTGGADWAVAGNGSLADALRRELSGTDQSSGLIVALEGGSDVAAAVTAFAAAADLLPTDTPARLLLVTRGAERIGADPAPDLAAAAVRVLPGVLGRERPGLSWAALDLGRAVTADDLSAILDEAAEIGETTSGALIARRGRTRWQRTLTAWAPQPVESTIGTGSGTVLITGGLGAVGRALARHLADHGHRVVVTTRAEPGTHLGAGVTVRRCDAADTEATTALLAELSADGPLTAVLHGAGVIAGAELDTLRALDHDRLAAHLQAKVGGAQALRVAISTLPGELRPLSVLTMSSVTTLIGAVGMAAYAAANAAMDALAADAGWTSIIWDGWNVGVDVAVSSDALDLSTGAAALDRILAAPPVDAVAVSISDLRSRIAAVAAPLPHSAATSSATGVIAGIWTELFGVPVGPDSDFFALGGHSLLGTRMLRAVHDRTGVDLSLGDLIACPTLGGLTALLDAAATRPAMSTGPTGLVSARRHRAGRPSRPVDAVEIDQTQSPLDLAM